MKTYSVTSKQVSSIHNGMCEIRQLMSHFEEMFKEDSHFNKGLKRAFNLIEPVRKALMDLKDADDDRAWKRANEMKEAYGFKYTVWSISEIENFSDVSFVPIGVKLIAPWESEEEVEITDNTWLGLWKAVEELASKTKYNDYGDCGFGSHVFIERFRESKDKKNTYEVVLGS